MQRTLERLAAERRRTEEAFGRALEEIRSRAGGGSPSASLTRLDEALAALEAAAAPAEVGRRRFALKDRDRGAGRDEYRDRLLPVLKALREAAAEARRETTALAAAAADLARLQAELADARDKEWDALGSNHVGMIFKSLEWRVDGLAAAAEDAANLVRTAAGLREPLDRLRGALESGERPSPQAVRAVLEPLEDWRYANFETRFRGDAESVRRQQSRYLGYLPKSGKVLDLGCGRGEFLELLRAAGLEGEGADLNEAMIALCRGKGLACERKDILLKLAECDDGSLAGIFSSQVIEHLPPRTLAKLVEIAHLKLAPGGALVLETVNPTSVFALVQIFFLDLSHQKPIHPKALEFLLAGAGFRDVAILYGEPLEAERLKPVPAADERAEIINRNADALNALLFGPPNYAVIGTKA